MSDLDLDALPCAVAVVGTDGRITASNRRFVQWIAAEGTDVRGLALSRFLILPVVDAAGGSARLGTLIGFDATTRQVLVARTRSGDGETFALIDATERARYEERLRSTNSLEERTRHRLQLVIDAAIAFAAADSETALAEILAATVGKVYGAEESVVFLTREDGTFRQAAGRNPFDEILEIEGFVEQTMAMHRVIRITGWRDAAAIAPALGTAMRQAGIHAIIAAPLYNDGVAVGVFACFFRHSRQFDDEAAPLADALAGQAAQVATTLRLQRRLEHAATHDDTTGLPNRRYLEERSAQFEQPDAERPAAIFIDLDGFKRVNDELGHHTGDRLLRDVGRRLRSALRDDDIVIRYGGDEFIVIASTPDDSAARDLAERLRRNLAEPFDYLPAGFPVGASLGIALPPADGPVSIDQLVRAADQAMYRSKAAGGGRIVLHTDTTSVPVTVLGPGGRAARLAEDLRGAVERGEISAWFQPQIDLASDEIVAAEALARWRHPEFGSIGPAAFIPLAEDAGLIGELGMFMAERSCMALEAWSGPGRPLDLSVNVSPLQLLTSEFTDWLADRISGIDLSGGTLTVEITESRPVADLDTALGRLETLRTVGIGVAIDDFGAGHASLSQLERLHGTEVKLDRSLVSDLSTQASREIANVVAVANESGIRVVAEGVDTERHLDRVRHLGCHRAQGFLISPPLPAARFRDLLAAGPTSWRDADRL